MGPGRPAPRRSRSHRPSWVRPRRPRPRGRPRCQPLAARIRSPSDRRAIPSGTASTAPSGARPEPTWSRPPPAPRPRPAPPVPCPPPCAWPPGSRGAAAAPRTASSRGPEPSLPRAPVSRPVEAPRSGPRPPPFSSPSSSAPRAFPSCRRPCRTRDRRRRARSRWSRLVGFRSRDGRSAGAPARWRAAPPAGPCSARGRPAAGASPRGPPPPPAIFRASSGAGIGAGSAGIGAGSPAPPRWRLGRPAQLQRSLRIEEDAVRDQEHRDRADGGERRERPARADAIPERRRVSGAAGLRAAPVALAPRRCAAAACMMAARARAGGASSRPWRATARVFSKPSSSLRQRAQPATCASTCARASARQLPVQELHHLRADVFAVARHRHLS